MQPKNIRRNAAELAVSSHIAYRDMARRKSMNSKKKLSELTLGEMINLEFECFEDVNIYRLSLVQIAKRFLSYTLEVNPYQSSFPQIRNSYIESSEKDDVSENENEFYLSVAKDYLWLSHEPKDKLLELFYRATDDIKKIDSQLHYINDELNKLESNKKSNGWLNGEERYNRNLLDYYKDKNESAKFEILDFMSKDIEPYAFNQCRASTSMDMMKGFFIGEMPYRYSRGIMFHAEFDRYDVKNMTEMSNKFLDLPVPTSREVKKLYKSDKEQFYLFAKEYISGELQGMKNALEKINEYIETNHLIASRKDILLTILKHYQNKDFISVVNILPMQIEGIFHDICLEIGIDESRLDISSINEKLRILQSHMNHFICFEYYSFKFPVIRNMVAHGKLMEGDVEHTAIMLMLDLLPVCDLSLSDEIPTNKKINLLKNVLDNDFDSLIEMFDYIDVGISEFYEREDDLIAALSKYKEESFWNYLEAKVKSEKIESVNDSKIMKFIRKLHGSKLCKKEASFFLENMPQLIEQMKQDSLDKQKRIEPLLKCLKKN